LRANFPVTFLCEKLGVSTSGFYEWDAGSVTATRGCQMVCVRGCESM
jgi:hypothetical protein